MPLAPLYDSYRYSMRWMDGDVSIPSPQTMISRLREAIDSSSSDCYICLYVTSIRLRISRSTAIDSFASTFHPFTTCVGQHLIYKPFRNEWCRSRGTSNVSLPSPRFTLIERIVRTLKTVCKGIVYPRKLPERLFNPLLWPATWENGNGGSSSRIWIPSPACFLYVLFEQARVQFLGVGSKKVEGSKRWEI